MAICDATSAAMRLACMPMRFGQDTADVAGAMGNVTDKIETAANLFEKKSYLNRSFKNTCVIWNYSRWTMSLETGFCDAVSGSTSVNPHLSEGRMMKRHCPAAPGAFHPGLRYARRGCARAHRAPPSQWANPASPTKIGWAVRQIRPPRGRKFRCVFYIFEGVLYRAPPRKSPPPRPPPAPAHRRCPIRAGPRGRR